MTVTVAPVSRPGFFTTIEALRLREWLLGPGQSSNVIDLFDADDFHFVVDDRGDVHIASKDGRFYLGWYPNGRPGSEGEGWKLAVTGTANIRGYEASFDRETPADIVAAAIARVLETSRPVETPTTRPAASQPSHPHSPHKEAARDGRGNDRR